MRTLIWSKTFIRSIKGLKRHNPQLLTDLQDTLNILVSDFFEPRLTFSRANVLTFPRSHVLPFPRADLGIISECTTKALTKKTS